MSQDIRTEVEAIRSSLRALSHDALNLRKSLITAKDQKPFENALLAVLKNCQRAIDEGKTVSGEEDLLPWIRNRIVSAFELEEVNKP